MMVVLGATGHIGRAVIASLRDAGVTDVRALSGHGENAVDAHDEAALRAAFEGAERLFLLNPPASPEHDTVAEEKHTMRAIVHAAAATSSLRYIVAESTYGAAPLEGAGDLGVLFEMEQMLAKLSVPTRVVRAAYYMSNWDAQIDPVRESGELVTLFPVEQRLPMVAPADVGAHVAKLLLAAPGSGASPIEGPEPYSSRDVAAAFEKALGRPVAAVSVPRAGWQSQYEKLGFSRRAAAAYSKMTAEVVDGHVAAEENAARGPTTLEAYVRSSTT